MLQDLLNLAHAQQLWHQVADQGGMLVLDAVQQRLDILATENRGRMLSNDLGQVGGDDRCGIDHRVPEHLGVLACLGHDPSSRQAKGWLDRRQALELAV